MVLHGRRIAQNFRCNTILRLEPGLALGHPKALLVGERGIKRLCLKVVFAFRLLLDGPGKFLPVLLIIRHESQPLISCQHFVKWQMLPYRLGTWVMASVRWTHCVGRRHQEEKSHFSGKQVRLGPHLKIVHFIGDHMRLSMVHGS